MGPKNNIRASHVVWFYFTFVIMSTSSGQQQPNRTYSGETIKLKITDEDREQVNTLIESYDKAKLTSYMRKHGVKK